MGNAVTAGSAVSAHWENSGATAGKSGSTLANAWVGVAMRPSLPDFPALTHRREISLIIAASIVVHLGLFFFVSQRQQEALTTTPPEIPPMVVEFAPPPPAVVEPPPKLETPPQVQPKAPPPPEAINPLPAPAVIPEPPAPAQPVTVQEAPPREAPPAPVVTTPPLAYADYLRNPAPSYPDLAQRRGWEGSVQLKVFVLASGRAGRVDIEKSSGRPILDDAAVAAVRNWRFVPSRRGSTPVDGYVSVPIDFKLN